MPIEEEKTDQKVHISPEMIQLFLGEFARDFKQLKEAVQKGSLPESKKALTGLLGSLKIVHLDPIIPLIQAWLKLETFPHAAAEMIACLDPILSATPKNLFQVVQNIQPSLSEAISKLGGEVKTEPPPAKEAVSDVDTSLIELFILEVESQVSVLNQGLLTLESQKGTSETYKTLMRAAHSLKGAARVVELDPLVSLGHAMEDCFVVLEEETDRLNRVVMDTLFQSVDFFALLVQVPKEFIPEYLGKQQQILEQLTSTLLSIVKGETVEEAPVVTGKVGPREDRPRTTPSVNEDRVLRVSTKSLNSLMGLAGESMVESLWLQPFGEALSNLKHVHSEMAQNVDMIRETLKTENLDPRINHFLSNLHRHAIICQQTLDHRVSDLEMFIRRHASLSERLYGEVIDIRMRPLSEGVKGFPRIVRDLGHDLGKKVRLEIIGEATPVDRDILDKLETPLMHLIRNAVDHGIESPEERLKLGKPEEGVVTLEATHRSGMLYITVFDDGKGVDTEAIKQKLVAEKIVNEEVVGNLTKTELLEFLLLPGFSTADRVTEISGRGVGLNIVQNMIQEVGGTIHISASKGHFLQFDLQLPLTLSVIRALMVEIGSEPYAFPLARIMRSILLPKSEIEIVENRQYFRSEGKNIGLVHASQVLDLEVESETSDLVPIVILSDHMNFYGVVVDSFIGEKDLVVQEIDPVLGKMPGISSGAFMEDGSPLLIIDVEDILRSIDKLLYSADLRAVKSTSIVSEDIAVKRILVVDDSITVREVECRLLQNMGYEVQTAVDGVDGWNAVRIGQFDLVITDVDMPRMNGIDLVLSIKSDPRLKTLPVMIVSYKDRDSDRKQGLEAGADYYLTKASFHNETLVDAVIDLIGPPNQSGGTA